MPLLVCLASLSVTLCVGDETASVSVCVGLWKGGARSREVTISRARSRSTFFNVRGQRKNDKIFTVSISLIKS